MPILTLPLKNKKLKYLFAYFVLLFIASVRAVSVGEDLDKYVEGFTHICNTDIDFISLFLWEPGYVIFNYCLSFFSTDAQILVVSTSLFILTGLFLYFYRYSSYFFLTLFLFIALFHYFSSFNIIRQFMALAILVNSLKYIIQHRFFYFLMVVFVAAFFHYTAIIFLILYPLNKYQVTWHYFIGILILSFGLNYLFGNSIITNLITQFYPSYQGEVIRGSGLLMFVLLFLLTSLCLMLYTKIRSKSRENKQIKLLNLLMHAAILACCFQTLSFNFSLFSRVVIYFSFHFVVLLPNLINIALNKRDKIIITSICCVFSFLLFCFYLKEDLSGIIPYEMF